MMLRIELEIKGRRTRIKNRYMGNEKRQKKNDNNEREGEQKKGSSKRDENKGKGIEDERLKED